MKGTKHDNGKPRYDLLPPYALNELAKVLQFGAKKYDAENWRKVDNAKDRYFAAAQRHLWSYKRGAELDQESGLHHLAHAVCCIMFIHELEELEK